MEHSHHHHHSVETLTSLNSVYIISIALNLGYVILELIMGLSSHSMGLLSDAGHKLIDCFSLVIAMVAFALTKSKPSKRYNYGFRKISVFISLINAFILLVAITVIIIESIEKFANPVEVNGSIISWTAGVGIIVSGISAFLLMKHQKRDINTRGAFLHMATDVLVSLGVVISGIIISLTSWNFVDLIVSIGIALFLFYNTCKLFAESFKMIVDAVPSTIDYDSVCDCISSTQGVKSLDNVRIWSVSITQTALTAQVTVSETCDFHTVLAEIKTKLSCLGISESTIELV